MSAQYPPVNQQPQPGAPYMGFPPPNTGYPPTSQVPPYQMSQQNYPPPGQNYPPPGQNYPPPGQNYPPPGGYAPPQQTQPGNQWAPPPTGHFNCPPGLEYLTSIDQLLVQQKVELLEAFTGFETANKYKVKNSMGQNVFFAVEDNDCCTRNCCGSLRPFDMKIFDNTQNEVIHLYRPLNCDSCWCPCCLQRLEIMAPPGNVIGYVTQEWSIFVPKFRIENAAGECVLRVEGPFCTFSMCGDVEFQVLSVDGSVKVGKITKQWSGLLREHFTDADHFGITFPLDLDVNIKAVLLGACFLIDFMFFEKTGNKSNDRPGMFW